MRFTTMLRAVWPLIIFALPGSGLFGQELTITCVVNGKAQCGSYVGLPDSLQRANIRLHVARSGAAVSGAQVHFRATAGSLEPDSTVSDANGNAWTTWFRNKGSDLVMVAASARAVGATGVASIRLQPDTSPTPKPITLRKRSGFKQSWFEKSQLPQLVMVELRAAGHAAITDAATCKANRVVFKPYGAPATVSPDTATAAIDDDDGRCYAWTYWAFGEGIGEREVDVSLVPGKGFKAANKQRLEADAWARATPKFVAGFGLNHFKAYSTLNPPTTRTVRIERVDASGIKHSYDTTEIVAPASVSQVPAKSELDAIAAVSAPIPIAALWNWDGISLTAGVDLKNPADRVFLGFSIVRLIVGPWVPVIESVPFDLHGLFFWARQPVVTDPACAPATCQVEKRFRYQGMGIMLSVDATSLVADLVKRLAP